MRAVHREAGDAEAGGDVLVAQQRIGGDPVRELACELARLLDARFRHQDHEFVAAIARHHIRAPAILFQNVADTLQHHVAFQVAVKIVHKFEAVQIHQHDRERPVRARGRASTRPRALPSGSDASSRPSEPSVIACSCAFWNVSALCSAPAKRSASVRSSRIFLLGEIARLRRIPRRARRAVVRHTPPAARSRKPIFGRTILGVEAFASTHHGNLARSRHLPHQAFAQGNPAAGSVASRSCFGLNHQLLGRVVENGDADVIVGQAVFDFLRRSSPAFRRD